MHFSGVPDGTGTAHARWQRTMTHLESGVHGTLPQAIGPSGGSRLPHSHAAPDLWPGSLVAVTLPSVTRHIHLSNRSARPHAATETRPLQCAIAFVPAVIF
jgi:hypothetical protein